MIQKSWLLCFSLCCLVGWATPVWALGEWDRTSLDDQNMPYKQGPTDGLIQRVLLWLLSMAGFYGLVRLLEDITLEQPLASGQKEAEVVNCDLCSIHRASPPKCGCPIRAGLKSLERKEQDLVTLLYNLRKHKSALASSWRTEDQPDWTGPDGLSNDVVIYTIQDET